MKENMQIKPGEISTGVSYEKYKKDAQKTYDTVVKPQIKRLSKTKNEKLVLSSNQKIQANCQSPY